MIVYTILRQAEHLILMRSAPSPRGYPAPPLGAYLGDYLWNTSTVGLALHLGDYWYVNLPDAERMCDIPILCESRTEAYILLWLRRAAPVMG